MVERSKFWYPPFTRMIKLTVKHRDKEKAEYAAKIIADDLRKIQGIMVLGPTYPPIPRLQTLYMQDIVLKVPRNMAFAAVRNEVRKYMNAITSMEEYKTTTFLINVDPY
jgi:primosomal protein N' (replication factor Y)